MNPSSSPGGGAPGAAFPGCCIAGGVATPGVATPGVATPDGDVVGGWAYAAEPVSPAAAAAAATRNHFPRNHIRGDLNDDST
jgi:hypothetical protein